MAIQVSGNRTARGAVILMRSVSIRCTWVYEGGGLAGEPLPRRQRGGAAFPVGLAIDEMAREAEVVVDGGELLQRLHLPEPEQGPISSSERWLFSTRLIAQRPISCQSGNPARPWQHRSCAGASSRRSLHDMTCSASAFSLIEVIRYKPAPIQCEATSPGVDGRSKWLCSSSRSDLCT